MTDSSGSARNEVRDAVGVAPARNVSGQAAILELLALTGSMRQRSATARFFGASPLSPAGRAAYREVLGEIEVGDALDQLGDGWSVLHSVSVGANAADIDHLVIGPGGIFIVMTAVHPGGDVYASQRTFTVSGIRYPHIRNMEYEMGRVERLLSTASGVPIEVAGILAVVDPKSLTIGDAHRDVAVLAASTCVQWLRDHPAVESAARVALVTSVAARSSTWHVAEQQVPDPGDLRSRFDALQETVTRAWRRQRLWAAGLTVVGAAAFIAVTYCILAMTIGAPTS